jgi:hypothetical protein
MQFFGLVLGTLSTRYHRHAIFVPVLLVITCRRVEKGTKKIFEMCL